MKRFSYEKVPYYAIAFNLYSNLVQLYFMNHMFEFIFKNPSNIYPFSTPVFDINFSYILKRKQIIYRKQIASYNYYINCDENHISIGDIYIEKSLISYLLFGFVNFKKTFYNMLTRDRKEYQYVSRIYFTITKKEANNVKNTFIKKKFKNKKVNSISIWRNVCL